MPKNAITYLPRVVPAPAKPPKEVGEDHPYRVATRATAFEPEAWTPERAAEINAMFASYADRFAEYLAEGREVVPLDALARGDVPRGLCLEIGSGNGATTPVIAPHFRRVVSMDVLTEMLCQAPPDLSDLIQGDAQYLPFRDGCADVVLLHNMFLFPAEVDRVLAPEGAVMWVNAQGPRTPIYLPAEEVAEALPGSWTGVASEAGTGTWCVLRRAAARVR